MSEIKIFDRKFVFNFTKDLLMTDSPTGFTSKAMAKIKLYAEGLGYTFETTGKGTGIIDIKGETNKIVGICAHIDTLGLMVRSVSANGKLNFSQIGSPVLTTYDGEYCKIYTRNSKIYTGTILSNSPSGHVYKDAATLERRESKMHVRLDNLVKNRKDVEALGICTGDYICIDPKTIITDAGFIKSRFLDDKLSVGVIFGVLKYIRDYQIKLTHNVKILFSVYEETGHGMAFVPKGISELIAIDMGCVGDGLNCTEQDVSICVKDSMGPYDYELTTKLINLAKEYSLRYATDIYPSYTSDIGAAWRGGNDVRGALIGPGVHASHGMERSHYEAVYNTMKLLLLYMTTT